VDDGPTVVVGCDGPVEMTRGDSGATRLVLSGGVRVRSGETTARARSGRLDFRGGGEAPETVSIEGEVVVDSPRFGAKADAARFRRAEGLHAGGGAQAGSFTLTLERRGDRAIELRVGTVRVTCGGPVVYRESARDVTLAGRLRAETDTFVVRAGSGVVTLARTEPGEGKGAAPAAAPPDPPDAEQTSEDGHEPGTRPGAGIGVERIEVAGSVDIVTKPGDAEGGTPRKACAARAVYVAADDVLVLTGDPPPEIESTGVVLTAPEIRLHIGENRIESPGGDMRAKSGPERPDGPGEGE
jgi:lipopolysaccharide export system protein LptA